MAQAWVELTAADGSETQAPSEKQMAAALAEVFSGRGDHDGEPGSAILRFGYDDGLMYEIEVNSRGDLRFEEWSDRDCELALASPRRMQVKQKDALLIWCALAQRQVARIRDLPWHND